MSARSEPLLHYLRLLTTRSASDSSDAVLLERFLSQRDETAFAVLLDRHGPMVLGVCRRILRDIHDAEDVFQATFLALARKAGSLRRPETLASWLYTTARHLAYTFRRGEARRCQREASCFDSIAGVSAGNLLDNLSARELLLALDEELAGLPETYRLPLILCHLEGHTHEEAARLLGCTASSVKGRLERGRKRLRVRLVRRGLTLSVGLSALESMATAPVSAALRQAIAQRALAFAVGSAEGIAANVLTLTETGAAGVTMTKANAGLVLLLLTLGLASGASVLFSPFQTEKPAEANRVGIAQSPKPELAKQSHSDRYGDPLPPGAVTRLGSIRLRHSSPVWAVAFAPSGKTLVSGGSDGWAFLWDVTTGKRLRAFRQNGIKSLAIDSQGRMLALASSSEGNVKLYELATGKELRTIPGHGKGIESVVFSLDGKLLATGGRDKRIRLWNAATGRGIETWQADRVYLPSLRFTPDGKSLAYILDEDGALRFRDVATGAEQKPPAALAAARIYAFCFAAEGKTLITGSADEVGLLQLWDTASGSEIRIIARTQGRTGHILLAPNGKSVWTADYDGRISRLRQWDLTAGKQLRQVPYPSPRMDALALSPEGKHLAAGDFEGNVYLWDTKTGRKTLDFGGHQGSAYTVVFTPDGRQVWTGGQDHTIRLWSIRTGEQHRQFSTARDNDNAYDLALRPDGKMLASAVMRKTNSPFTEKCDVRLWDLSTNKEREPLRGHGGWVWGIAFSHDGRMLATRSWDQTIRLWDIATSKERHVLRCQWQTPWGVAFTPDDSRVVSFFDKDSASPGTDPGPAGVRRAAARPIAGIAGR